MSSQGLFGSTTKDTPPIGSLPPIYTKHQGFVMDMSVEDIQRNLELQEIEYRRFKTDVYTRMRQFEEVIADLKYILKRKDNSK